MEMRLEEETMETFGQISRLLVSKRRNNKWQDVQEERAKSCSSPRSYCRARVSPRSTTASPITLTAARLHALLPALSSLFLALLLAAGQQQPAQAAMNLPDGIENILGFVPRSTFQCERDGYFGDTDNDCRIFHLCQRQVSAGGRTEWRHWTYACGNQTMFNQLTLTCAFVDEAIPCRHASQFQYLNEVINKPSEPFLTDADVTSGFSYYSNRIMSDGARARAFQDSQLFAQIGGGQAQQPSVDTSQDLGLRSSHFAAPSNERASFIEDESDPGAGARQFFANTNSPGAGSSLVENHSFRLQHGANINNNDNIQPQQSQRSQQLQLQHQHQFQPLASAQANSQQQQTPQASQATPSSFLFALTTNHAGPASSHTANLFQQSLAVQARQASSSPFGAQHHSPLAAPPPPPFQTPVAGPTGRPSSDLTTSNDQLASQFGPRAPVTTTGPGAAQFSPQTTTTAAAPTATTTTTPATSTPTTSAAFVPAGARMQTASPTRAGLAAAATTTTAASVPASTLAPSFGAITPQPGQAAPQHQRRQSSSASSSSFANNRRAHVAFQSIRLSAPQQQSHQRQQTRSVTSQPLVMRRSSRAAEPAGQEFWRQPSFQPVTPKFESMIMRRRL